MLSVPSEWKLWDKFISGAGLCLLTHWSISLHYPTESVSPWTCLAENFGVKVCVCWILFLTWVLQWNCIGHFTLVFMVWGFPEVLIVSNELFHSSIVGLQKNGTGSTKRVPVSPSSRIQWSLLLPAAPVRCACYSYESKLIHYDSLKPIVYVRSTVDVAFYRFWQTHNAVYPPWWYHPE